LILCSCIVYSILMWIFPVILLAHPLNFFTSTYSTEQEIVEDEDEEDEEDICYIPAIDREDE